MEHNCSSQQLTWEELMGNDLTMSRLNHSQLESEVDLDPELLPSNYSEQQQQPQAEHGDVVIVSFWGYCVSEDEFRDPDTTMISSLQRQQQQEEEERKADFSCQDQLIVLGDNDIIPGVELACRFLLPRKEAAWLKCHYKFAFGAVGRTSQKANDEYSIPPYSQIIFYVHVRSVIPSSDPKLSTPHFQIKMAQSKKQLGNDVYQHEWSKLEQDGGSGKTKALKLYGSASDLMIQLIKDIRSVDDDNHNDQHHTNNTTTTTTTTTNNNNHNQHNNPQTTALNILMDCLNNISAVHFRAKDYGKAKEAATAALRWDLDNLKALCRAAKAAIFDPTGTFEESEMAIQRAERIEPNDSQVQSLRQLFNKKKRQHQLREKAMYGKMAKGIQPKTNITTAATTAHEEILSSKTNIYTMALFQSMIVCVFAILWLRLSPSLFNNNNESFVTNE